jgi:hypothetical protein
VSGDGSRKTDSVYRENHRNQRNPNLQRVSAKNCDDTFPVGRVTGCQSAEASIGDVNQPACQRAESQESDKLQDCRLASRRRPVHPEGGGDQSIEMPRQERIQTTSPDPKIEPGQKRANHGRFRTSIVDQRKAIDPQVPGQPVECMLDRKEDCQVQNAGHNLTQTHSAYDFGAH